MNYIVFLLNAVALSVDLPIGIQSGYIKVGDGVRYFYFLAPAQSHHETAPLVLWLTGGPGCSSAAALFIENGPYFVHVNLTLSKNDYSWNKIANMLYVDQPAGAGYSYSTKNCDAPFCISEQGVDKYLFSFLQGFIVRYPKFKKRAFYITGESYAGHYVSSLAAHIIKLKKDLDLDLRGIAMGNAMVDPRVQFMYYHIYAKEHHLVTPEQQVEMEAALPVCLGLMNECQQTKVTLLCVEAFTTCGASQMGVLNDRGINMYDITKSVKRGEAPYGSLMTSMTAYMRLEKVKHFFDVPENENWLMCDMDTYMRVVFGGNFLTSYTNDVNAVLRNNGNVFVYAGANDFACNWDGTEAWVNKFAGERFAQAPYKQLDGTNDTGIFKQEIHGTSSLTLAKILHAGHMAPADQPALLLNLIDRFLLGNNHKKIDSLKEVEQFV
eukprot:GEMP01034115.1.p1 GENE.GEMP01034115.1~~GEMP01034115.1.p1  ORF type:complete len:480 (+),score=63.47 GEMP01034115.1:130-1440(+)